MASRLITTSKEILKKRDKIESKFLNYRVRCEVPPDHYVPILKSNIIDICKYVFPACSTKCDVFNDTVVITLFEDHYNEFNLVYHIDSETADREYVVIKFINEIVNGDNHDYFTKERIEPAIKIALAIDMLFYTGLSVNNYDNILYTEKQIILQRQFDLVNDRPFFNLIYQTNSYANFLLIAPDDSVVVFTEKHFNNIHLVQQNVLDSLLEYFIESKYHAKYVVERGDTLDSISQKLNVPGVIIMNLNPDIRFTEEDLIPGTLITYVPANERK